MWDQFFTSSLGRLRSIRWSQTARPTRGRGGVRALTRRFRNINLLRDLPTYRLPAAGWVSILHRVSGVILVLSIPGLILALDSLSETPTARRQSGDGAGTQWYAAVSMVIVAWAATQHLIAGLRHLWMDVSKGAVRKEVAARSAVFVLVLSGLVTALVLVSLYLAV